MTGGDRRYTGRAPSWRTYEVALCLVGAMMLITPALSFQPPIEREPIATIDWNAAPLRILQPQLASFTSDLHSPDTTCKSKTPDGRTVKSLCWANASVLTLNLTSPRLRAAAAALAPAYWRIGGGPADQTRYDMGGTPCGDTFYCLTAARWEAILEFAHASKVQVIFGLNYLSHCNTSDPAAVWDAASARALLQRAHDLKPAGAALRGLELGNELNSNGKEPDTTRLAKGFGALRSMIAEIWRDAPQAAHPLVIGPDVSHPHDWSNEYLGRFLDAFEPDAATWHHYPGGKLGGSDALICTPSFYDEAASNLSAALAAVHAVRPGVPLWWGEGAFMFHSGADGVTNAFEDVLFSAVQLGSLAALGVGAWMRQTLAGGNYEMVAHADGFRPLPTWWLTLLFKRVLVGAAVLATRSDTATLRAFAYRGSAGSVALLLVNLASADVRVALNNPGGVNSSAPRHEYALESAGDMHARGVRLNRGAPLEMGADGTMPELPPRVRAGDSPIVVAARSVLIVIVDILI